MSLSIDALRQMVEQNHTQTEEGHGRLRQDYNSMETRVTALEVWHGSAATHFARIDELITKPVEVSALRFTPQMVVAIIAICTSILGSAMWLRSGVESLFYQVSAIQTTVNAMQKMQQMNQYDIQELKQTLTKLDAKGPR